jgi:hypothetical protein
MTNQEAVTKEPEAAEAPEVTKEREATKEVDDLGIDLDKLHITETDATKEVDKQDRPTISVVMNKMESIINKSIVSAKNSNKGSVGHLLEDMLGIPRSSACLDCIDGEVKVFPIKKRPNGTLTAKETVAVTMLSQDNLLKEEFIDSKCYQKMKTMLMIPYLRESDTITYFAPTLIVLNDELFDLIKADYNEIRQSFIETGELHSKTGTYLQNRTKGPGGAKKTRAYYLRQAFMNKFVPL